MTGIYKITNKINNKSYIGQSVHIERRWSEHCFPSKTSQISLAIQKYGKDNFIFDVIEECSIGDLDERERYWIEYYHSESPNGYNIASYIDGQPTHYSFCKKQDVKNIISDLLKTNLTFSEISEKYNVNVSTISRINKGETHIHNNLIYPLREKYERKRSYCNICGKELSSHSATYCKDCYKEKNKKGLPVSRKELKRLIRIVPFTTIGKKFNVSDNAIRKWCDKYNLPRTKKEINSYSDKEWDLI